MVPLRCTLTRRPPVLFTQHHGARLSRRCLRGLANGSSSSTDSRNADSPLLNIHTRPVPDAPLALATSPQAFLEYIRSPDAVPFLLRAPKFSHKDGDLSQADAREGSESRAGTLLRTLRTAGDRLVEVEVGRYDKVPDGGGRIEVPLRVYLDWLGGEQKSNGGERLQLYLAQWRARDEVPGLADEMKAPSLLAPLLESHVVDLYQTSFFVGPSETVTPLHYDPYFNLYNVYASSDPAVHAKHFVLLPPALSHHLARADGSILRNTSPVELTLHRDESPAAHSFVVAIDPRSAPLRTREALVRPEAGALSCVLREGDTLFVPRRWWHRVENVRLQDSGAAGWTAGVGWWFLPRSS